MPGRYFYIGHYSANRTWKMTSNHPHWKEVTYAMGICCLPSSRAI
jgi:hypothetical protein